MNEQRKCGIYIKHKRLHPKIAKTEKEFSKVSRYKIKEQKSVAFCTQKAKQHEEKVRN